MEEKKKNQKEFSTCFDCVTFAEMMQKMKGRQGIGSLCKEMMGSMMKKCCGVQDAKEEKSHV
jgi:hypothetical protein